MAASLTTQSCDLTSCNKCHQLLKNPKSLPCLHSYCASCLETEIDSSKNSVKCLVCGEDSDLPGGGVKDMEPLAIVQRLTEQKAMQTKLMAKETINCTACDGINTEDKPEVKSAQPVAVARCTECDDYLCTRCVAVHRSQRIMRDHPVFTFDELRSGKVQDAKAFEQKICTKHKGEVLLFYCETCDVPICRQCVVVAHRHPEHKQAELEQAAKERGDALKKLRETCKENEDEINKSLHNIRETKRDLDQAVSEAKNQITETVQKMKSLYLKRLDEAQALAEEELNSIDKEQQQLIKTTDVRLMSISSRISAAQKVTKKLIDSGSEYEIASAYSSLKHALHELGTTKPPEINKVFTEVKFEAKQQSPEKMSIGRVHGGTPHRRKREITAAATLQREFGNVGNEKLSLALDVVITPIGDIAVTDHIAAKVKVYNNDGIMKFAFKVNAGVDAGKTSHPWCIQVGSDKQFYVTDYNSPYVKIFDVQGTYKRYFYTVSPENVPYTTHGSSTLCGICFNSKDQVLVGNVTHNFISCHSTDGTHISSIKVDISPHFLAVTSKDHIVISHYSSGNDVHIIDGFGKILYKLQKPGYVSSWSPAGVTVSKLYTADDDDEDEVFIADRQNGYAIYRYSASGKYVDCVTKEVSNIYGLTLSIDEKQLFGANTESVNCFQIQSK